METDVSFYVVIAIIAAVLISGYLLARNTAGTERGRSDLPSAASAFAELKRITDLYEAGEITKDEFEFRRLNIRPYIPHPDSLARIVELLRNNKKIEAIKLHRTETGAGLKEAKDVIDEIEQELKRS